MNNNITLTLVTPAELAGVLSSSGDRSATLVKGQTIEFSPEPTVHKAVRVGTDKSEITYYVIEATVNGVVRKLPIASFRRFPVGTDFDAFLAEAPDLKAFVTGNDYDRFLALKGTKWSVADVKTFKARDFASSDVNAVKDARFPILKKIG